MCGLVGGLFGDSARRLERHVLESMTRRLVHRGPDDEGYYEKGSCSLGFRRLSILDLTEAGRQPMCGEDGSVWVVCNGEIYNFRSLREELTAKGHVFRSRTDVETIVHGYEEWGDEVLDHLDGMFALAVWDEKKKRLLLARDRFGIKPLHYAVLSEGIVFASEIKALLAYPNLPRELDWHALWNYLTFAQVPAPETIYRAVRKVLPGHKLVVEHGQCSIRQYYQLPVVRNRVGTVEDLAAEYRALLDRAVKSHLVADVPVGCFLSGGIDSSLLVALATKAGGGRVRTFSVEFTETAEVDESRFQRQIAEAFETEHHVLKASPHLLQFVPAMLRAVDEPFAIASFLPLYVLSQMTAQHVKVVLSGDGADELFAGYAGRYSNDSKRLLLGRLVKRLAGKPDDRIWSNKRWSERIKRRGRMACMSAMERYVTSYNWFWNAEKTVLLQPNVLEQISNEGYGDWIEKAWDDHSEDLDRKLRYEFLAPLPDEMLVKADRATSAWGLEARVPFLDRQAAEYAWSIPGALHWQGGVGKRILKAVARGTIPDNIIDRPKTGFNVPVSHWLQDKRSDMKQVLLEKDEEFDAVFRPEAVRTMIEAHETGAGDCAQRLWVLYVFKHWLALNRQR